MVMVSPFANSVRATPVQAAVQNQGLGSIAQLLQQLKSAGPRPEAGARVPQEQPQLFTADVRQEPRLPVASMNDFFRKEADLSRPAQVVAQPANPFEGNEQYQALMEYQQSLAPTQEQQTRLQELRSAFEGTGAYKDYRIQQMEQQMQQMQQRYRQPRSPMGMGLGMANPYGMQPFRQPMRQPMPMPRGGYNQYQQQPYYQGPSMNQGPNQLTAMQQQYMNPYQQMRPQPQQFGGYGMGQQMGGYGSFGGMPNPYQPQQMGYNQNNYSGYAGQQNFASFG
jgi:hypothetical protein